MLLHGFHTVLGRLKRDAASIRAVYVDETRRDPRMRELLAQAGRHGVTVNRVDAQRIEGLAPGRRHQGLVALTTSAPPGTSLEELFADLSRPPRIVLLDGVTDPRNLGACLRAADGAGMHAVIAPRDHACPLSEAAVQTAAGAAESVPYLLVTNLSRCIGELQERGLWVVGLDEEAEQTLWGASWPAEGSAFVLGAEGRGLRRLVKESCDILVRLPMLGSIKSLNVAVATGVVLYEAVRRRL
ncbi:MAG: 23S rRNA (guanosine(2251)-2'-O)-methyltransferase RlmB [Betaproteobacteria bacterium]|nr:23S rRNA (guanosine(2251)-2'-O)-methyltransferase RlmB [Betaproteobacteria bacterium]